MQGVRGQLSDVVHTEIKVGGEEAKVGGHRCEPPVGAVGPEEHPVLLTLTQRRAAPLPPPCGARQASAASRGQPEQAEQEQRAGRAGGVHGASGR